MIIDLYARPDGHTHRPDIRAALPTFEITDKDQINALLALIDFDPHAEWGACECHGELLLRFYRDQETLALVSFHHGEHLRWRDSNWTDDPALTPLSQRRMNNWLANNGCPSCEEAQQIWIDALQTARRAAESQPSDCHAPSP